MVVISMCTAMITLMRDVISLFFVEDDSDQWKPVICRENSQILFTQSQF